MTVEELMIPRVRVIAEYPNSPFDIGHILTLSDITWQGYCYSDMNLVNQEFVSKYYGENCPAIFNPLQWYEERNIEDMPQYIKSATGLLTVSKVEWCSGEIFTQRIEATINGYTFLPHFESILPATLQDYENYLNLKK